MRIQLKSSNHVCLVNHIMFSQTTKCSLWEKRCLRGTFKRQMYYLHCQTTKVCWLPLEKEVMDDVPWLSIVAECARRYSANLPWSAEFLDGTMICQCLAMYNGALRAYCGGDYAAGKYETGSWDLLSKPEDVDHKVWKCKKVPKWLFFHSVKPCVGPKLHILFFSMTQAIHQVFRSRVHQECFMIVLKNSCSSVRYIKGNTGHRYWTTRRESPVE